MMMYCTCPHTYTQERWLVLLSPGIFLLSNELYNHSIGGHIYSISYSLFLYGCVFVPSSFLVNMTRNVCWFWRLLFRHPSLHHPVSTFFSFLSLPRVFRAIPLQTRNKMNQQRESVTPSPRKNENKKDLLLLLFFFLLEEEKESGANKLVQQLTLLMIING